MQWQPDCKHSYVELRLRKKGNQRSHGAPAGNPI